MHTAAKNLYTSVQNISKSIKDLENELGVPLIYRTKFGFAPTGDGKIVYEKAVQIRECVDFLQQTYLDSETPALNRNVVHNIKVASICSMTIRLRQLIYKLSAEEPSIGFSLYEYEGNALNHYFKNVTDALNDYDFFFLACGDKNLLSFAPMLKSYDIYVLCTDYLGLSINKKNPLAQEKSISLAALKHIPLASFQESPDKQSLFFSILSENGFHQIKKPLYVSNNHLICNDYVEQNKAAVIACVPDAERHTLVVTHTENRIIIPFKEPIKITHLMAYPNNRPLPAESAVFKKNILDFFKDTYYKFTN